MYSSTKQTKETRKSNSKAKLAKCQTHPDSFLSIYCVDCDVIDCPVCLTLNHHPDKHIVFLVEDLQREEVKEMIECKKRLNECQNYVESNLEVDIDAKIKEFEEKRDKECAYYQKYAENLRKRYDEIIEELKDLKNSIEQEKEDLEKQQEQVRKHVKKIENESYGEGNTMGSTKKGEYNEEENEEPQDQDTVVDNVYKTIDQCHKKNNIINCQLEPEKSLEEKKISFTIENYKKILCKRNEEYNIIKSPVFKVGFFDWYIGVNPYGDEEAKNRNLSVFLYMISGQENVDYEYEYRIEIENHKGKKNEIRCGTKK